MYIRMCIEKKSSEATIYENGLGKQSGIELSTATAVTKTLALREAFVALAEKENADA